MFQRSRYFKKDGGYLCYDIINVKIRENKVAVVVINKNKNKIFFIINADKYMSAMVVMNLLKAIERSCLFAIYYLF